MRIALAQLNVVVGDLDGNVERIGTAIAEARRADADLVVLPELAVTGYPPEDLLLRPGSSARRARRSRRSRARATGSSPSSTVPPSTAISPTPHSSARTARSATACKHFLPNYGVFDEHRLAGRELLLLQLGDVTVGPTICEDVWQPGPPATDLALAGATLLVNLSASPYHGGKAEDREEMLVTRARDNAAYVAFCNLVGEPGRASLRRPLGRARRRGRGRGARSRLRGSPPDRRRRPERGDRPAAAGRAAPRPRAVARQPTSCDDPVAPAPLATDRPAAAGVTPFADELEQLRRALGLGLRDYVEKNGFQDVVVSVSGGIDLALTAAIAADALGPERVHTVSMPSRFSSGETRDDARSLAENLGVEFREIAIEDRRRVPRCARRTRGPRRREPAGADPRHGPELSNSHGWLVLATGTSPRWRSATRRSTATWSGASRS